MYGDGQSAQAQSRTSRRKTEGINYCLIWGRYFYFFTSVFYNELSGEREAYTIFLKKCKQVFPSDLVYENA